MDNYCFILLIRQRVCQSGVPVNTDNTYTNVPNNTQIQLSNGYILTIYRISNDQIRLSFLNRSFDLNFFFDVNNGSTNILDLPLDGGTYRIEISAIVRCCCACNN